MSKKQIKGDINFLYEVGSLRNTPRGWMQHFGVDMANDLEHTMRVMYLALMIAKYEKLDADELIMKMALVHDVAETRTSDHSYVQKVYVEADETRAADDLFRDTSLIDLKKDLHIYEERVELAAKIVKDADNLDVDIELKELEERGHQLSGKWRTQRKFVRDTKLYTDTAKAFWDEIQTSDPAEWHIAANKWKHLPNAGK